MTRASRHRQITKVRPAVLACVAAAVALVATVAGQGRQGSPPPPRTARAVAPIDLGRLGARVALAAWCLCIVLARAAPRFLDVSEDDRALAAAVLQELPGRPDEVAFVESDARYGLRFYLGSEVERLEFPGDPPRPQAQDFTSEMHEREGCRVLLVGDWKWARLEEALAHADVAYKRLADVRGYAVIAQKTPDCPAYAAL